MRFLLAFCLVLALACGGGDDTDVTDVPEVTKTKRKGKRKGKRAKVKAAPPGFGDEKSTLWCCCKLSDGHGERLHPDTCRTRSGKCQATRKLCP